MQRVRFRRRRVAEATVVAAMMLGIGTLDTGSATFVESTQTATNGASSHAVFPPAKASAEVTLNVVPLLTCRAEITWEASTTAGVASYEVRRIVSGTGLADGGPWSVPAPSTGTPGSYIDDPVSILGAGLGVYQWQVRAVTAGGSVSHWTTAVAPSSALCL